MLNQNQETIIDHVGAENWEAVVAEFSDKSEAEIKAELDRIWASDDNTQLAQMISEELS